MGFFDKLTSTKYPDSGVVLLPAMELRAALLRARRAGCTAPRARRPPRREG